MRNLPLQELPLNIGTRTINKDFFGMPMSEVWAIMTEQLYFAANAYDLKIYAFVLMSNHFHLLASAPPQQLSAAMQFLLAQSSRQIAKSANRINHIWKAKFFRKVIGNPHYYLHAYKYFYRNPVEAGICERVEDYPYSTLHGLLGQSQLLVPMVYDDTFFSDVEGTLAWLNTPGKPGYKETIQKALRRAEFKLPRISNRYHPLETEEY